MANSKRVKLDTHSARLSLPIGPRYNHKLQTGLYLVYRKGLKGGTWTAKRHEGGIDYSREVLGLADDRPAHADGIRVLNFDQAQAKARQWFTQKAAEDAGEVVAGDHTVADAMADYLKHQERMKRKSQHWTEQTVKTFILPVLGDVKLSKLTHGKVKAWRDALAEAAPRVRSGAGQKPAFREVDMSDPEIMRKRQSAANRIYTVLRAALNFAYTEGKIGTKAAWERVRPFRKTNAPKVRFLTLEEVAALLKDCEPKFQSLVKGALVTGARYSELGRLKVTDFSPEDRRIYIAQSKNGEARNVHLNEDGVALFRELTKDRESSELIFLRDNGMRWKKSDQGRDMIKACDASGVQGVTFHILRHTYASHAVMNGMPLEVLAEQLGHKDITITIRYYAHLCPSYKQGIIEAKAPNFGFTDAPAAAMKPRLVERVANAS
jgi:integrase